MLLCRSSFSRCGVCVQRLEPSSMCSVKEAGSHNRGRRKVTPFLIVLIILLATTRVEMVIVLMLHLIFYEPFLPYYHIPYYIPVIPRRTLFDLIPCNSSVVAGFIKIFIICFIITGVMLFVTASMTAHFREPRYSKEVEPERRRALSRRTKYRWKVTSSLWFGNIVITLGFSLSDYLRMEGYLAPATSILVAFILAHGGVLLFCYGSAFYAKSKGYSALYGLLGLFWLLGGLILLALPDRLLYEVSSERGIGTTNSRNA